MRESAASHCSRASWRAIRCFSHCAHAVTSPSAFDKKKTTKRSASTNTPRRTRRAISPPSSARAGDSPAKQRAIKPIRRRIGDYKFKRNKNDNGRGKRIVPFHRPLRATGFALTVAEVIKLGATHVAAADHLDVRDHGAVGLEYALHTLAVRYLAHGNRGVEAAVALNKDHTNESQQTFTGAFLHLHLHLDGVAGREGRKLVLHLFRFELLNNVAHDAVCLFFTSDAADDM